jgi:DNA-binding PadR family transcriptional regulator
MPPVFAHGRLRLYLLKLLDEAPRHGYEVIRLLEERFQGLYAPSAGTVYPRLAKLEAEGLVTHSTEGGRKVYAITDAGRAELTTRADEIADLENEIRESVATLAAEIRADVRGAAGDLRREIRAATQQAQDRTPPQDPQGPRDLRDAARAWKDEWREQARQAKAEARDARRQAKEAREAMEAAREELQRIVRRVQTQTQEHVSRGDWPTGLREGLAELTRELGQVGRGGGWPGFGRPGAWGPWASAAASAPADEASTGEASTGEAPADQASTGRASTGQKPAESAHEGPTAEAPDDAPPSADPLRDLERLLDGFRDDVRDAARDHGVTDAQLRECRSRLKAAAAHIGAVLREGGTGREGRRG